MTDEDFIKIFYSNFPLNIDWDNIDEIAWMYQEGLFTCSFKVIATSNEFQERIDMVTNPNSGMIKNGESFSHMALKSLAKDYLVRRLGVPDKEVKYEYPLIGFEVDVIDEGLCFPTECGDTNALKLEKYLMQPTTKKMFILPYPHADDVRVFEFCATTRFFEYIKHKQSILNQENAKRR